MRTLRTSAVVIGGSIVAATVAGIAYASIPDSAGVIHGCYAKSGGTVRVTQATTCKSTEGSLSWNAKGPKGDTGPSAVTASHLVSGTPVTLGTSDVTFASVTCPAGQRVLSTGVRNHTDNNGSLSTVALADIEISTDQTKVTVLAKNTSTTSTTTITAQAICG